MKVIAPPERKKSTWLGGSILSSLGTFEGQWVTRAEYEVSCSAAPPPPPPLPWPLVRCTALALSAAALDSSSFLPNQEHGAADIMRRKCCN